MSSRRPFSPPGSLLCLMLPLLMPGQQALAEQAVPADPLAVELDETQVLGTAEREVKQALGASVITAEDIARHPPVNDLSDIIRREPGVNLTGNTASGARGNNRQIDIRGMGPENTLILVDGKRVSSRNAVRYGWSGDRDTRGDSNWVPAEMVERIEVLRGPAAARYGSGAMGGVVNIITKRPTEQMHGSLTLFGNRPQDDKEGSTQRANFSLSGPLGEALSFRLYGSGNKTDADDVDINAGHQLDNRGLTAGREGVRNKDLNGLLNWRLSPEQTVELEAGYSRQGNIYAGDSELNGGGAFINSLYGQETNVLQRSNFALTHLGDWLWGSSKASVAYDYTRNWRLNEGLYGRDQGAPLEADGAFTSRLKNLSANGEINLPLNDAYDQVVTLGAEYLRESLVDPGSLRDNGGANGFDPAPGTLPGFSRGQEESRAYSHALFAEDNIHIGELTLTPGLRYDHHQTFGDNFSPSLNASYRLDDHWTLKTGISRAYKTPNLYQANPNYLLYSRGRGCFGISNPCFLQGNDGLRPETSINKELGLAFDSGHWRASATWFRNDYKDKIESGIDSLYLVGGTQVYQWTNVGKAVVEGFEGNLFIPLAQNLEWNSNLTYIQTSENRETGQPLSVIPKYTLNSSLDWQTTDRLSLQANVVWYGKQESPTLTRATNTRIDGNSLSPYALFGISGGYRFNENLSARLGVSNLFDKRLYREGNAESGAGAATYNEPGRALYASLTTSF